MAGGLMAAMMGGKGAPDEPDADDTGGTGLEDEYLTDAFDALVGKDRKAFISAMRDAIRACNRAEQEGEYSDEMSG